MDRWIWLDTLTAPLQVYVPEECLAIRPIFTVHAPEGELLRRRRSRVTDTSSFMACLRPSLAAWGAAAPAPASAGQLQRLRQDQPRAEVPPMATRTQLALTRPCRATSMQQGMGDQSETRTNWVTPDSPRSPAPTAAAASGHSATRSWLAAGGPTRTG